MDKTAETRDAMKIVKDIKPFKLIENGLTDRVAYAKAVGNGKSVFEIKPRDKKACEEISKLAEEVFK